MMCPQCYKNLISGEFNSLHHLIKQCNFSYIEALSIVKAKKAESVCKAYSLVEGFNK